MIERMPPGRRGNLRKEHYVDPDYVQSKVSNERLDPFGPHASPAQRDPAVDSTRSLYHVAQRYGGGVH